MQTRKYRDSLYYATMLILHVRSLAQIRYTKKNLHGLSPRELNRPSNCRLSAKLVPIFADATWSAWRFPTAVFSAF
jgi:hypothetical protein